MFTSQSQVETIRMEPARELRRLLPEFRDVLTLSALALFTGAFVALAIGVISGLLNHPHPFKTGFASWTIVSAGCWMLLLLRWSRMLGNLERWLSLDINGDGYIGDEPAQAEQEPQAPAVRVEISENDGKQVSRVDLPATQAQIKALAIGLMSGSSFSESAWTGHQAPFSKAEFIRLRDEMLKRRLIQWRNERAPAQGLELSKSGKAVMRYFASEVQS